jgi:hypothetical protein
MDMELESSAPGLPSTRGLNGIFPELDEMDLPEVEEVAAANFEQDLDVHPDFSPDSNQPPAPDDEEHRGEQKEAEVSSAAWHSDDLDEIDDWRAS